MSWLPNSPLGETRATAFVTSTESNKCTKRPSRRGEIPTACEERQSGHAAFRTREMLSSIVTRIELRFDHEETGSGRHTSTFRDGTIYLRPDAGEARSSNPKSTQLSKIGPVLERREYGPDLR